MKLRRFLGVCVAVFALTGCHLPATPEGKRLIRIAVLPAYSLEVMTKKYVPFMEYLSRESGLKVEYVSSLSYSDYLAVVEGSRVDFGLQNALIFQILRKTRSAYPVVQALGSKAVPVERGVIVTHAKSGIQEIGQLKGKRIMATSKRALAGYLAQADRLREAGIDPERDVRIILGGRQDEVLLKILLGEKADAAFIREDVLEAVRGRVDLTRIRIIGYTEYFPTWCLAAFRETDPTVVAKVQEALLKLTTENPEHVRILDGLGAAGFIPADPERYEKVLEVAAALRLPL
ncbi:MAG: phosphate/phosphite/phosphonate ABC transporter substrate-binding protein [candidate division NC10 bacterium]|nr:phosphate/phosphite/phosphonate ABC transporter substrate-binding protein [candidate division NC10 bacterium]